MEARGGGGSWVSSSCRVGFQHLPGGSTGREHGARSQARRSLPLKCSIEEALQAIRRTAAALQQ